MKKKAGILMRCLEALHISIGEPDSKPAMERGYWPLTIFAAVISIVLFAISAQTQELPVKIFALWFGAFLSAFSMLLCTTGAYYTRSIRLQNKQWLRFAIYTLVAVFVLVIIPVFFPIWLLAVILQKLHITTLAHSFDNLIATALTYIVYLTAMLLALIGILLPLASLAVNASETAARYVLYIGTLLIALFLCWAAPQIYCFIWILLGHADRNTAAAEKLVKQDFETMWKLLHLIAALLIKPLSLSGEAGLLADVLFFVFLAISLIQTILPAKQDSPTPAA